MLALADIAAEAERLAEGEPTLDAEAALDHRAPEDEHILRHRERRFRRHSPPRLNPRHAAGLQLCDDLVGDFLIEARPVPTGASASG
jgi:hypothetical protein